MKTQQAPRSYIVRYYNADLKERLAEPVDPATKFYIDHMRHVVGNRVLNVGCGPQFYDELRYFGSRPSHYQGIDINRECIKFLQKHTHPRVLRLRAEAQAAGTRTYLMDGDIRQFQEDWREQFDCIVAVGVFGAFSRVAFAGLAEVLYAYLQPSGRLVFIDWREPLIGKHRINIKVRYRFCASNEGSVADQVSALTRAGFLQMRMERHDVADAKSYGWRRIYGHVFEKPRT